MREEIEGEFDLFSGAIAHWLYLMQFADGQRNIYQKILVPLDRSREAEGVLPLVQNILTPDGEVILLHIIPPVRTRAATESVVLGGKVEDEERTQAMAYLRNLVEQLGEDSSAWRCEVVVSSSVAEGIADFAAQQEVDLIAMYTHDRKGLAKLIKGSTAVKVQKNAPTKVQVFRPRELVAV